MGKQKRVGELTVALERNRRDTFGLVALSTSPYSSKLTKLLNEATRLLVMRLMERVSCAQSGCIYRSFHLNDIKNLTKLKTNRYSATIGIIVSTAT